MEMDFVLDQEDVKVTVVEEIKAEITNDYSELSFEDYATQDESEIEWDNL